MNNPIPATAVEKLIDAKDIQLRHQIDVLLTERLTGLDKLQGSIDSCSRRIDDNSKVQQQRINTVKSAICDLHDEQVSHKAFAAWLFWGVVATWIAMPVLGALIYVALR